MIVFLCDRGSALRARVSALPVRDLRILDLDAPQADLPVSIDGERVTWQGVELTAAEALVIERPAFAWPQRLDLARDERSRRALVLAALHTAALRVPTFDPPESARWSALPTAALAELAHAGLDVHPWVAAPLPEHIDERALWFDVAGDGAGDASAPPSVGAPAWSPEPFDGPIETVVVAGERVVGGARWRGAREWARNELASALVARDVAAPLSSLAARAARALRVTNLELDTSAGAVLRARVGADLARWDAALSGAVLEAIVERASRAGVPT